MSAASPVHTSWADAMDDEETLWATGSASTVADAFVEPAVSVQPAVSTELPLHTVVGADVQPDTGDEHESEDDELPPYTKSDNPTFGLKCYLGCDSAYFSWKSLMKHLRNKHAKKQSQFKGTDLYEMSMQEQRDEDRQRYYKKLGKPCPPRKGMSPSMKRHASAPPAPPRTERQPIEPSAASSESAARHAPTTCAFVWHPPEEFYSQGYNVIKARHHSLRRSSDGQVTTEADGTVWRSVWVRCDSAGVPMVSPVHIHEQTPRETQGLLISRSPMALPPRKPPTHWQDGGMDEDGPAPPHDPRSEEVAVKPQEEDVPPLGITVDQPNVTPQARHVGTAVAEPTVADVEASPTVGKRAMESARAESAPGKKRRKTGCSGVGVQFVPRAAGEAAYKDTTMQQKLSGAFRETPPPAPAAPAFVDTSTQMKMERYALPATADDTGTGSATAAVACTPRKGKRSHFTAAQKNYLNDNFSGTLADKCGNAVDVASACSCRPHSGRSSAW